MTNIISEKQAWEILAIGYLTRNTGKVWEVTFEQEHMDCRLLCKCEDQTISTSHFNVFDFGDGSIVDKIPTLLDLVIGLFNHRRQGWRPIKAPRLVCPYCGSHDWFVFTSKYKFCRECTMQFEKLIPSDDWDDQVFQEWYRKHFMKKRDREEISAWNMLYEMGML